MKIMEVSINANIYRQAQAYAQQKGLNLSKVIEDFLLHFIGKSEKAEHPVPDVVLSLLGAGTPVDEDDLNGRKAYHEYLEEKYK